MMPTPSIHPTRDHRGGLLRSGMTTAFVVLALGVCAGVTVAAEVEAELTWANAVTLSIPVSGRVRQVDVREGASVGAGDPLLRLDTRIVSARVAEAQSAVRRLELQRAEAQREWDRAKELYDRTVLSERELQLAEIGFNAADAEYHVARTAQVNAEVDLENHVPRAPFAARVLAIHVRPGQAVINNQQPTPLVTLAEAGRMRARARVDLTQAAALAPEASAAVRVGDRRFEAHIHSIGLEPAGAERPATYAVEAEFAVPADVQLRAGQPATLVLP